MLASDGIGIAQLVAKDARGKSGNARKKHGQNLSFRTCGGFFMDGRAESMAGEIEFYGGQHA